MRNPIPIETTPPVAEGAWGGTDRLIDLPTGETALWVVVVAALAADVYTTALGLQAGLVEGNPAMRWAIAQGGFAALALAKVAALGLGGLLRAVRPQYRLVVPLGLAVPWLATVAVNAVTLATL